MGAVLGSCLGSCAGSCALGACCACCSCRCIASPGMANLAYVLTIVVGAIAAVSLRYGGVDLNVGAIVGTQGVSVCTGSACEDAAFSFSICNGDNCKGYWAVYRIAFTLAGYHLMLCCATACRSRFSALLHHGYWFAKVALLTLVLVGTLFAPNDLFAYFSWAARIVAPLFLLYQLILFIDFGYALNSILVEKDEEQGGNTYKAINLLLAALCIVGSLAAIGAFYAIWPLGSVLNADSTETSCAFNPLAITTTLLFGILNTALSISSVADHGSLLCSALVLAYTTWLCYATLAAFPLAECNPLHSDTDHAGALATSCIVAGLSLGYIAYRTGSKQLGGNAMTGGASKAPALELADLKGGGNLGSNPPTPPANDEVVVHVAGEAPGRAAAQMAEERIVPSDESYWGYHLQMFIVCMYMAMVLTDWGVPASSATSKYSVGYVSAWLEMSMNWVCSLLYCWTLIAPKVCPGRSFE